MSHSHEDNAGHSHSISQNADKRYLSIAMLLILGFMLAEVIVGILASSLALITDAAHMVTDAAAVGIAIFAMSLASRPAQGMRTFGLKRVEILSAQANGITLLLLSAYFVYEAINRLIHPPQVEGLSVVIVAIAGIVVNLLAAWFISRANRQSLNVEGSYQHIATDLYAFIATAIAGIGILITGISRLDAIAALVVAVLMLKAGYGLVKDSGRIFLEAAPENLDPEKIGISLAAQPGVERVHDMHVWEVTSGFPAMSAHIVVNDDYAADERNDLLERLTGILENEYAISHSTIQIETERCDPCELYCDLNLDALADSDGHAQTHSHSGTAASQATPKDK